MAREPLPPGCQENWLLASLPEEDYARLLAACDTLACPRDMVVIEPDVRIEFATFPLSGCLSMVSLLDGGGEVEVGTIGWEGMAGLSLLHGVPAVRNRCVVQVPGVVRRIPSREFLALVHDSPAMAQLLMRYANVWMEQLSQSVACNGAHRIEQRLARWLLLTHDRVEGDVLHLTQHFMAVMLAVRRASVTTAATALQNRRLIDYLHGRIVVTNRAGLEEAACECYAIMRALYDRLLPDVVPERT